MSNPPSPDQRGVQVSLVLLAVGVAAVILSFAMGKPASIAELVFDGGVGLSAATGISLLFSIYIQRLERARLKASEEAERTRQKYERAWSDISAEISRLNTEMSNALDMAKVAEIGVAIHALRIELNGLHDDVRMLRLKADPTFKHPDEPIVDELFEAIREEVESAAGPDQQDDRLTYERDAD